MRLPFLTDASGKTVFYRMPDDEIDWILPKNAPGSLPVIPRSI
jgi:hypothetical protein